VIDTVKWVIKEYGIDADRAYLCGNSMGGSGTLGIGMRHGEVFAAIKANVPAEVKPRARRIP
jgi:predicted peptidase